MKMSGPQNKSTPEEQAAVAKRRYYGSLHRSRTERGQEDMVPASVPRSPLSRPVGSAMTTSLVAEATGGFSMPADIHMQTPTPRQLEEGAEENV
jgi:hypothetical protein